MEIFLLADTWISLLTLTVLEIVLGIDNIVFISILTDKLPQPQQAKGRTIGLALAMITRVLLLLSISWVMTLTGTLLSIFGFDFSGRALILLAGGLFLIYKSTIEIHHKLEDSGSNGATAKMHPFWGTIGQIVLLDIVFSLDSVITAVGMANHLAVMIAAVVIAVIVMLWASGPIARFVNQHPTVKILALSFLLMIGISLLAEVFGREIPKGYIYFAMAFSVLVEVLNLKAKKHKAAK